MNVAVGGNVLRGPRGVEAVPWVPVAVHLVSPSQEELLADVLGRLGARADHRVANPIDDVVEGDAHTAHPGERLRRKAELLWRQHVEGERQPRRVRRLVQHHHDRLRGCLVTTRVNLESRGHAGRNQDLPRKVGRGRHEREVRRRGRGPDDERQLPSARRVGDVPERARPQILLQRDAHHVRHPQPRVEGLRRGGLRAQRGTVRSSAVHPEIFRR